MTVDEIKAQYSLPDMVNRYGIRMNRAGFIHCPFHEGDRTASCKIYKDSYHCHACGANGDVIDFVGRMENCSFKEAFFKLGGTYEKKTDHARAKFELQLQQKKKTRELKMKRLRREILQLSDDMAMQRIFRDYTIPFSDDWCDAVNRFEMDYCKMQEKYKQLSEV